MSSIDTARALLAGALEMQVDEVSDDAAIGHVANWDSLAHMRLVLTIEQHIGHELEPHNVIALESLRDIVAILDSHDLPVE